MRVLVTGANGFLGSTTATALEVRGHTPISATRNKWHGAIEVGSVDGRTDWSKALTSCDVVIHTAARVHQMQDHATDRLNEFRKVNTEGTLQLARQASKAHIRRLIFLSTIKVHGEEHRKPCCQNDALSSQDPYGISKMEAEQGLRQIAAETGMEVVIVRPPLVYGPGVKANFASMMRAVQRGIPLPLASVTHNRRSFVALDNLVDLLITCIDHPAAANQTFLVSDGEDLSTADLLRRLGLAMNKPARLLPVPPSLLQLGANLLGKGDMAQRLLGNLQVDISHTRNTLNWSPPLSVDEGLRRAVAGLAP
ncbi:UDP-glucose 4-epimerase family protein [Hydrogenophaga sp. PBL-H3]|uniref:UDP-glucose 4-epimerase family protein n=1 Tax=Hydrogenophaga sp. PBL-H3 TaxID=434010 RepID=UPI00131FEE47|nr:SDR family oxidoreductase [Hydrogenophaga sp. PBL-H3]QHE78148.1 SDR family oxidoreductase [Hydrogenophaga sp. PBL-H3]QHE82573.1 SDR family oxidoreductase [Hydrogenophaga sp. PBL-H3]